MKRVAMIGAVLAVAAFSFAQSNSKPDAHSRPRKLERKHPSPGAGQASTAGEDST